MRNAKRQVKGVSSVPRPACPGCGMIKSDWPGEGYTHEGESYCCQGCAEGTGCQCTKAGSRGFSREGQVATRAEPRPGRQRSGAPAPQGGLSGERDARGTEEAIDQEGYSTVLEKTSAGAAGSRERPGSRTRASRSRS